MEWVKLGDVTEINIGKTPDRKNTNYWGQGNIWVSISDMNSKYISNSKEEITDLAVSESNIKIIPENTVIMSFKLTIGKVAITEIPLFTNEAIASFKIDENLIPEYLYYVLRFIDYDKYVDRAAKGKTLNKKKLNQIKIPVCSLQEQNKIIDNLRKIESIISTRKAQIAALDELVQSVFYEMFGDVDDSKFATDIFKNLTSVNQGLQIAKSKRYKEYVDNSYEYITIQYLNGKKDREYVVPKSENVICNKEDILVTRTGNTGQIVTGVEGVFHNNFFKVNYNKALLLKEYLYYFLNLKTTQSRIKLLAGTSTIPDLNHGDFYSIEIPLPPLELQEQFAAKVEAIEAEKAKLQTSLEEMETLFDALMQEAFSGNLG